MSYNRTLRELGIDEEEELLDFLPNTGFSTEDGTFRNEIDYLTRMGGDMKVPGNNLGDVNTSWYPGKYLGNMLGGISDRIESHGQTWYPGKYLQGAARGVTGLLGKAMDGIDRLINADFMQKRAGAGGNWFPSAAELKEFKNRNKGRTLRETGSNLVPNNIPDATPINAEPSIGSLVDDSLRDMDPGFYNEFDTSYDPANPQNLYPDEQSSYDPTNPMNIYPDELKGLDSVDEALSNQKYQQQVSQGEKALANSMLSKAYQNEGVSEEVEEMYPVSEERTFPYTDPDTGHMYFSPEEMDPSYIPGPTMGAYSNSALTTPSPGIHGPSVGWPTGNPMPVANIPGIGQISNQGIPFPQAGPNAGTFQTPFGNVPPIAMPSGPSTEELAQQAAFLTDIFNQKRKEDMY